MHFRGSVVPAVFFASALAALVSLVSCNGSFGGNAKSGPDAPGDVQSAAADAPALDRAALRSTAGAVFGVLPEEAQKSANPATQAKVALGRQLYFDPRLSKNHDVSCNSCHGLESFGQDNRPFSPGHRGQLGGRSSPSVYNAALHIDQFWDGRADDVEAQAKGPVLNPVEMAMPSEAHVARVLRSIPGYVAAFDAAFPGEGITYDNMANAIGVFERGLMTPAPLDDFIAGDLQAMSDAQLQGMQDFIQTGCVTCHMGPAVGGGMYRKLGLVKPYTTSDAGRFAVTKSEADRFVFKVPSLRNIHETAPYFHDGSVKGLAQAVQLMAEHQLGVTIDAQRNASIRRFLKALTGRVDLQYTAAPELPASGPKTPAPDPS